MAESDGESTKDQTENRAALGGVVVQGLNQAISRGRSWIFIEYAACERCGSCCILVDNYQEIITCTSCRFRFSSGAPNFSRPGELSALHFLDSIKETHDKRSGTPMGRIEESLLQKMPKKWRDLMASVVASEIRKVLREVRRSALKRADSEVGGG